MPVAVHRFPILSTSQLINRHASLASLDIPQRLIDTADGVIQYRTISPVGAVIHGLPKIVDPIGGLADEKGAQIFFNSDVYNFGALGERSTSLSIESVPGGDDFHNREA